MALPCKSVQALTALKLAFVRGVCHAGDVDTYRERHARPTDVDPFGWSDLQVIATGMSTNMVVSNDHVVCGVDSQPLAGG